MRRLVISIAFLLLLPLVGYGYYNIPFSPVASGGPQWTLDDDFTSDVTGWAKRSDASLTCTNAGGDLVTNNNAGLCHYSGTTEGTQPTTDDQWAVLEFGSTGSDNKGPAVRLLSGAGDPGGSIYNYVIRCTASALVVRVCSADVSCEDVGVGTGLCAAVGTGDQLAIMVAGEGLATEICAWWWESADGEPSAFNDPTTWGSADYCVTSDAAVDFLSAYSACGGATSCEDWDTEGGAPDSDTKGYPANTQFDTGYYSGSTTNSSITFFISGDL